MFSLLKKQRQIIKYLIRLRRFPELRHYRNTNKLFDDFQKKNVIAQEFYSLFYYTQLYRTLSIHLRNIATFV